jgi:hypothetical protein
MNQNQTPSQQNNNEFKAIIESQKRKVKHSQIGKSPESVSFKAAEAMLITLDWCLEKYTSLQASQRTETPLPNGWISVETPPENNKKYLIYCGCFHNQNWFDVASCNAKNKWFDEAGDEIHPTHYRELPAPPSKEAQSSEPSLPKEKLYRWVKASERTPTSFNCYHVKYDGESALSIFQPSRSFGKIMFVSGGQKSVGYYDVSKLEWLEEYTAPLNKEPNDERWIRVENPPNEDCKIIVGWQGSEAFHEGYFNGEQIGCIDNEGGFALFETHPTHYMIPAPPKRKKLLIPEHIKGFDESIANMSAESKEKVDRMMPINVLIEAVKEQTNVKQLIYDSTENKWLLKYPEHIQLELDKFATIEDLLNFLENA